MGYLHVQRNTLLNNQRNTEEGSERKLNILDE